MDCSCFGHLLLFSIYRLSLVGSPGACLLNIHGILRNRCTLGYFQMPPSWSNSLCTPLACVCPSSLITLLPNAHKGGRLRYFTRECKQSVITTHDLKLRMAGLNLSCARNNKVKIKESHSHHAHEGLWSLTVSAAGDSLPI